MNHTGLRRQRSRSSYCGMFENPGYGQVRGLRKASLGRLEIATASAGSTPWIRRTVTLCPWYSAVPIIGPGGTILLGGGAVG